MRAESSRVRSRSIAPTRTRAGHQGVGTWIERRARVAGDHVALICGDTHRTYAELAERVRRLSQGLRSLGVTRADRVGWLGPNHPAFLETLFATASLGAILTPINQQLGRDSIEAICARVDLRVMFVHGSQPELMPRAATATVVVDPLGGHVGDYERLIATSTDEPIDALVGLDDPCLLPFTSGTTGMPKGIRLTHGNLTWNVMNVLSMIDVHGDDVTIAAVPFFRVGGTGVTVLPVLFKGGTVVIPRSADPDEFLLLVERHRATIGFSTPNALEAVTRAPRWPAADLTSLRTFVTGGAPVPERLLRTFQARRVNVVQGYGLSEAAPLVSVLDAVNAPRKIGSVGRPALFIEIRIAGPDGADSAVGEIGELLVRGPNVTAGYWQRPKATRRAIDEQGWLRTGDAAYRDAEGFLFVVGRIGDAFISEGQVVHPGVVERVLQQHPSVAEACVLGGDAGPIAYVVLADGALAAIDAELGSLCSEQLAGHARPAVFRYVASLPKNAGGKVLRRLLLTTSACPAGWDSGRAVSRCVLGD